MRTESLATLDTPTRDRVLARSYQLLISMAPMVPAIEHIFTASLAVCHFGPTYPLLVSPWLPLALCDALGRGPVSIVLPRGTRLRAMPRLLRGVSHVLLTPWKGEPLVVGSGSLLSVASELLLRSPLLVQEYVADTSAHTASVALPIADADDRTEAPSASLELSEVDISDTMASAGADITWSQPSPAPAHEQPEVGSAPAEALAIQRALDLSASIGAVQLVRLPRTSDEGTRGEATARWLPLCLHFGLPLSDVPTCDSACAAIASRRLFSNASMASHGASLAALLGRVEKCVSFGQIESVGHAPEEAVEMAEAEDVMSDEGAYPPTPLCFDGARLTQLGDVDELY